MSQNSIVTPIKKSEIPIIPKNKSQEDLIKALEDNNNTLVFATGPSGTGKTLISVLHAINLFNNKNNNIKKLIISRPVKPNGEDIGYLPGDIREKMDPWVKPIIDIFQEYWYMNNIEKMIEYGKIEIAPLAYLRGRTFKNCVVILDEAQNATIDQMKMALTRIGRDSRMFVTGDINQTDIYNNGLENFFERLSHYADANTNKELNLKICNFKNTDVVRHKIVQQIVDIYNETDELF